MLLKSSPSFPIKHQKKSVTESATLVCYHLYHAPTEGRSHMRESPPQVRSGGWWRVVWTVEIQLKCIADVWRSLPHCCCCRTLKHLYSSHLRLLFFALCHRKTTLHFNEAKDKWRLPELHVDTYRRTSKPEQLLSGVQRLLVSLKRLVYAQNNIYSLLCYFKLLWFDWFFRNLQNIWRVVMNCAEELLFFIQMQWMFKP